MKILQVVTYISPDGAYGGPVRVAINQAKALSELGHEVTVVAAAGGFDRPMPKKFDDFPVRLFPARRILPRTGFAGLTSPALLVWFARAVKEFDVVHIHLARDLVTLPAAAWALIARKPVVAQTHGMIDRTSKRLAVPLDYLLTRPVLRHAKKVFYLTDGERKDLTSVAGEGLNLQHLPNGVKVPHMRAIEQLEGAQEEPEVLFLARLHPRKYPLTVVRSAQELGKEFPRARFTLVGPDEGEQAAVRTLIAANDLGGRLKLEGPVAPDKTLERMQRASIYLLPSKNEPFPMAVLEAMSIGLPVIITDSCGLAEHVRGAHAGIVSNGNQESVNQALRNLLDKHESRQSMGSRGRALIEISLSAAAVSQCLEYEYSQLNIASSRPITRGQAACHGK